MRTPLVFNFNVFVFLLQLDLSDRFSAHSVGIFLHPLPVVNRAKSHDDVVIVDGGLKTNFVNLLH